LTLPLVKRRALTPWHDEKRTSLPGKKRTGFCFTSVALALPAAVTEMASAYTEGNVRYEDIESLQPEKDEANVRITLPALPHSYLHLCARASPR
jgi:hypothetical protein